MARSRRRYRDGPAALDHQPPGAGAELDTYPTSDGNDSPTCYLSCAPNLLAVGHASLLSQAPFNRRVRGWTKIPPPLLLRSDSKGQNLEHRGNESGDAL